MTSEEKRQERLKKSLDINKAKDLIVAAAINLEVKRHISEEEMSSINTVENILSEYDEYQKNM